MDPVQPAAVPPILDPAEDRLAVRERLHPDLRGELPWLAVMAVCTAVEVAWWAVCWATGRAPLPMIGAYVLLAGAALAIVLLVRRLLAAGRPRASFASIAAGFVLIALGASLFLPLKYAIPGVVPFWLDGPLAAGERALLGGTDPWRVLDRLLGWAVVPVDRVYALWLPVQTLALFAVLFEAPSRAKARALIAYSLAWFLLGVVAALLLSSAGPLFFDRLYGGHMFAAMRNTLQARGAVLALAESDLMWTSFASKQPGFVAGMSAAPSLHVAISLWIFLAARALAPKAAPLALAYTAFIWVASVQLGWHYVADGLLGIAGMLGLWALAGRVERTLRLQPARRSPVDAHCS